MGDALQKPTYLITGGLGYIGRVLTDELIARGSGVIVVDNELVAPAPAARTNVEYVCADVRRPQELDGLFEGLDGVVHLAAIVGDAACDLDHDLARDTNLHGTVAVAQACQRAGVRRMVFASTCSAYGLASGRSADVQTTPLPQTLYAQTKVLAERHLVAARTETFAPCILRLATIHGLSPRMRFDLVVNGMTARAVLEGRVHVYGGQQWRPFLHVRDAASAIAAALVKRPAAKAELYNCGSDRENYRLLDVGLAVSEEVPGTTVITHGEMADRRDYRVSFVGAADELGFSPSITLREGIREVREALLMGRYDDYAGERYQNHLLADCFLSALRGGGVG